MKTGELASQLEDGSALFVRLNSYTGLAVRTPRSLILIDPDIPDSKGRGPLGDLAPEAILVSHSHGKHFAPANVASLAADNTRVLATWKVIYSLKNMPSKHPRNMIALRPGNSMLVGDVDIEAHGALHPSKAFAPSVDERFASIDEGNWREQHLSFAITPKGMGKIYHMSDSVPFKGLEKIEDVEVAVLPVNLGHWNSAEDAALAVKALRPRIVLALSNLRKGGLLDRWSARRERGKLRKVISSLGAETVFLDEKPYVYKA